MAGSKTETEPKGSVMKSEDSKNKSKTHEKPKETPKQESSFGFLDEELRRLETQNELLQKSLAEIRKQKETPKGESIKPKKLEQSDPKTKEPMTPSIKRAKSFINSPSSSRVKMQPNEKVERKLFGTTESSKKTKGTSQEKRALDEFASEEKEAHLAFLKCLTFDKELRKYLFMWGVHESVKNTFKQIKEKFCLWDPQSSFVELEEEKSQKEEILSRNLSLVLGEIEPEGSLMNELEELYDLAEELKYKIQEGKKERKQMEEQLRILLNLEHQKERPLPFYLDRIQSYSKEIQGKFH